VCAKGRKGRRHPMKKLNKLIAAVRERGLAVIVKSGAVWVVNDEELLFKDAIRFMREIVKRYSSQHSLVLG